MIHKVKTIIALCVFLCTDAWCALTVILVRHAEVTGATSDPPLSSQGKSRAELLASILRDIHLDAIYVTEFTRTQQTAQPSAGHLNLRPLRLAAGNSRALVDAIRRREAGALLVVGHSNTIPTIISMLGGPAVNIGETEFDNLFVLTVASGETSALRFRYGSRGPAAPVPEAPGTGMLINRSPVMKISFARSGGFPGALRNVKGTINLENEQAEVSSDAAYHRTLTPDEAEQLRAGADPSELSQAVNQIASRTRRAADLEHYHISVT